MPRKGVAIFAEAMDKKLQRDDNIKSPWETENLTVLFSRLLDEVEELADAKDPETKMLKCCDIANFAMMIFSKLHPDTQHLVRGRLPEPSYFMHGGDTMPSDRAIMKGGFR